MELMCPHCHSNNRVGPEGAADAARFVCASCGTQFEAVLVEGSLVTVLPREGRASFAPAPADDLLDLPGLAPDPPAQSPPAPGLEDVRVGAPAPPEEEVDPLHITEAAPERTPAAVSAAAAAARLAAMPALRGAADDATPARAPEVAPPKPAAPPAQAYDKYAVGMRVLRVSPMWLLLSSLGFFAVLLGLSWMSKPVVPVEEAVASSPRMLNQATSPAPKAAPAAQIEEAQAAAEKALPAAPPAAPVEAPKPAPAAQPSAPSGPAPSGNFTVQVGSFNNSSEANGHVSKLRAAGFEARAVPVELPGRGTWHRVQAGRFATRDEAAKAGAALRAKGLASAALVAEVN